MVQERQLLLGELLRDDGMAASASNADRIIPDWSDRALWLLWDYASICNEFMAEDARLYARSCGLETPPSKRAWGSVITKARKEGIISFVRYSKVKNPKAHMANAAVWRLNKL